MQKNDDRMSHVIMKSVAKEEHQHIEGMIKKETRQVIKARDHNKLKHISEHKQWMENWKIRKNWTEFGFLEIKVFREIKVIIANNRGND